MNYYRCILRKCKMCKYKERCFKKDVTDKKADVEKK